MISTVSGRLDISTIFTDAIKNAFPMGSMTGAPKITVMKTIEKYENFKRGLYSGAVGYIDKNGDFDFSVVIRSILLNLAENVLSLSVGSAITYDSTPESEYSECLLKAEAITQLLAEIDNNS